MARSLWLFVQLARSSRALVWLARSSQLRVRRACILPDEMRVLVCRELRFAFVRLSWMTLSLLSYQSIYPDNAPISAWTQEARCNNSMRTHVRIALQQLDVLPCKNRVSTSRFSNSTPSRARTEHRKNRLNSQLNVCHCMSFAPRKKAHFQFLTE